MAASGRGSHLCFSLLLCGCSFSSKSLFFSAKDIIRSSYGGRFEVVSGFDTKSIRTGVVKDKETGMEYFASIDSSGVLVIGAAVLPVSVMLRPATE